MRSIKICNHFLTSCLLPMPILQPKTEEQKEGIKKRLIKREDNKRNKLKDLGIEYDFDGYSKKAAALPSAQEKKAITDAKKLETEVKKDAPAAKTSAKPNKKARKVSIFLDVRLVMTFLMHCLAFSRLKAMLCLLPLCSRPINVVFITTPAVCCSNYRRLALCAMILVTSTLSNRCLVASSLPA